MRLTIPLSADWLIFWSGASLYGTRSEHGGFQNFLTYFWLSAKLLSTTGLFSVARSVFCVVGEFWYTSKRTCIRPVALNGADNWPVTCTWKFALASWGFSSCLHYRRHIPTEDESGSHQVTMRERLLRWYGRVLRWNYRLQYLMFHSS